MANRKLNDGKFHHVAFSLERIGEGQSRVRVFYDGTLEAFDVFEVSDPTFPDQNGNVVAVRKYIDFVHPITWEMIGSRCVTDCLTGEI
jgi:hypothetical protein